MEEIIRLISGCKFEIAESWGMAQLSQILMNKKLGATDQFFKEQFDKSLEIDIYHNKSFSGHFEEMDTVKPGSIAVVSMSGVMMANDGWCNKGARTIDRQFRALYNNKDIAGIIFDVDSGGGQSHAGDIIYNALLDRNKPVVVHTTYLGSAAVKGTLPADEIIAASDSTEVGSIGTMMSVNKKMVEKSKETDLDIYSRHSPDKNGGWRELKAGNLEPLIERATVIDEVFMSKVKKHRSLKGTAAEKKKTLAGGVFIAQDAKKRGLIDGVGSFNHALHRLNSHIKYYSK